MKKERFREGRDSERERETLRKEPVSEFGKSRKKEMLEERLVWNIKEWEATFVETERKGRRERKEARIRSISKRVRLGQE